MTTTDRYLDGISDSRSIQWTLNERAHGTPVVDSSLLAVPERAVAAVQTLMPGSPVFAPSMAPEMLDFAYIGRQIQEADGRGERQLGIIIDVAATNLPTFRKVPYLHSVVDAVRSYAEASGSPAFKRAADRIVAVI